MQAKKLVQYLSSTIITLESTFLIWIVLYTMASNPKDVMALLIISAFAIIIFIGIAILCFDPKYRYAGVVFSLLMIVFGIQCDAITLSEIWWLLPLTALCAFGLWWSFRQNHRIFSR